MDAAGNEASGLSLYLAVSDLSSYPYKNRPRSSSLVSLFNRFVNRSAWRFAPVRAESQRAIRFGLIKPDIESSLFGDALHRPVFAGDMSGTGTLFEVEVRRISPNEAFFLPTRGMSSMPMSSKHLIIDTALPKLVEAMRLAGISVVVIMAGSRLSGRRLCGSRKGRTPGRFHRA
jgi:hypothetical protein